MNILKKKFNLSLYLKKDRTQIMKKNRSIFFVYDGHKMYVVYMLQAIVDLSFISKKITYVFSV